MAKQRRRHTLEFKAKVALESLKNQWTTQELASHYELHPTQISEWKKELSEQASEIFAQTKPTPITEPHSSTELYEHIGLLQVDNECVKKH